MTAQFRPFDVVAVAVGEGAGAKRRPALVVSNPNFENSTGLVWVAMITTPDHEHRFGDIPIGDQAAAGLPAASVIRVLTDRARKEGRTVVVATHDPALIERLDASVRLEHGRMPGETAA